VVGNSLNGVVAKKGINWPFRGIPYIFHFQTSPNVPVWGKYMQMQETTHHPNKKEFNIGPRFI
jgi:hypothetical protein